MDNSNLNLVDYHWLRLCYVQVAETEESLGEVLEATLLALQLRQEGIDPFKTLIEALERLKKAGLVKDASGGMLGTTALGRAAFKGVFIAAYLHLAVFSKASLFSALLLLIAGFSGFGNNITFLT